MSHIERARSNEPIEHPVTIPERIEEISLTSGSASSYNGNSSEWKGQGLQKVCSVL